MSSFIWRELYIISDDTQTNNVSVSARISSCLFVTLSSSLIIGNDEQEKYSVYIERWVSYWRPTTARPDSWCECFHASQTTASSAVPAGGPLSDERRRFSHVISSKCSSHATVFQRHHVLMCAQWAGSIAICRQFPCAVRKPTQLDATIWTMKCVTDCRYAEEVFEVCVISWVNVWLYVPLDA